MFEWLPPSQEVAHEFLLLWMPLVVSLSVAPVAADQINYSSLEALEASGIGPRIAHRDQTRFPRRAVRGMDWSRQGPSTALLPNGFLACTSTARSIPTRTVSQSCSAATAIRTTGVLVQVHMLGGELVGASLGDRWGEINEPAVSRTRHAVS